MSGALCRRCDNYLGSGRWRCFSKVRCLSAASSDFWKTLLATFQSLSSFHRRSLSRPYASSSASVKPRNPATPKEKRPHMQPLTHITIETISNPTSDHPEIIRADNPPVSLKLKPLIMKLRLIISSLKLPQKHLIIIITADLQAKPLSSTTGSPINTYSSSGIISCTLLSRIRTAALSSRDTISK